MHAMVRFLRFFLRFAFNIPQGPAGDCTQFASTSESVIRYPYKIASQSKMNNKNVSNLSNLGHFKLQLGSLIV